MSDITELQKRALEIKQRYAELNAKEGREAWGGKEYAMGFVGDVGALLKNVMAKENLRPLDNIDARLAHQLADCLWCVLVLADQYDVDLEKSFIETMNQLETRISENQS
jgi:NTP pyrophosphatase (non-canonical NTP hydrolase)